MRVSAGDDDGIESGQHMQQRGRLEGAGVCVVGQAGGPEGGNIGPMSRGAGRR